ncbi:hypothetical protein ACJMK2_020375 [Sinanodonta woodiana]|uniref:Uncharacterized protein n=1 Tax=Sinanodonta woodiana TaxID=1069815 RepID=A0ABD3TYW1_SINWO
MDFQRSPTTFTPAYMWEEFQCLPRPSTTYGKMNEWWKMTRGRETTGVPLTMSDGNWHQIDYITDAQRKSADEYNNKFKAAYADLTSKIAYRYPNPGLPRIRQGRIGGSWRHIKEVLGHGGSRVVFVDGLVSTYDQENFNQALNGQIPYRPHLKTSLHNPNKIDVATTRQNIEFGPSSKAVRLPAVEELPMMSENERARKMALQSPHKHKGFYRYN